MKKIKILALFGESGCGKDSIQNLLLHHSPEKFHKIVSYTTRPKRENEQEGFDYHFISDQEFFNMVYTYQFIEALEFNKWFYGSAASSLHETKINVGIYTPEGIACLKESAAEFNLKILPVYVFASDKTRLIRILNRELHPDFSEIFRRWDTDKEDFQISLLPDYYRIVHNQKEPMEQNYIISTITKYCEDFFD